MPKRQRVPRYATVAAGEDTPTSTGGSSNTTKSPRQGRRSSTGIQPSSSPSTRNNKQELAKTRHAGEAQSPRGISSHQKQTHPKRPRQQQRQQLAAQDILLQLLKACEKHHLNCHQGYHPKTANECHSCESDLPATCQSAITNLRMLIPKLESTIAPFAAGKKPKTTTAATTTASKDILQLCLFYDNVVRGNYCPHMPHVLGCGKDPGLILDKVLYLLKNSLAIQDGQEPPSSKTDGDTYLDVLSRTISGLTAFAIDDTNDHIRTKLFVDWIHLAEDLAVLWALRSSASNALPVKLNLFEESSWVIDQRSKGKEVDTEGEAHTEESYFSLELHSWNQVKILQTIVWKVLDSLTSKRSALERLQTSPEQQQPQNVTSSAMPLLLGGDVDLFFPSDIVTDLDLVSSLLAGMKPALLLLSSREEDSTSGDLACKSPEFATTVVEILTRMCLDWHRLGTARVGIPLLSCTVDAAVLATRAVLCAVSGRRPTIPEAPDEKGNLVRYEKGLAVLLHRAVCHPPGLDDHCGTNADKKQHGLLQTIHSTVWTILLDCLEGIANRLCLRRRRTIDVDGVTPEGTTSTISPVTLDVAVLETIHYIAATTPSLALTGSYYCTARRIFSNLFFLSSKTSLSTQWSDDDKTLMRVANRSLAVFLHAVSTRDPNSVCLLEDTCQEAWKRNTSITKRAILGRPTEDDEDLGLLVSAGNEAHTGGWKDDNGNGGRHQSNLRGSKRKREPSQSEVSPTIISSHKKKEETLYSVIWYEALGMFLGKAFDAGEGIKESYAREASKCGTSMDLETAQIIEQIFCLSSALCLCLSMIRKLSTPSAFSEDGFRPMPSIFRVTLEFSKQILRGCNLLLNSLKKQVDSSTVLSIVMADAVLECGLSMHFTLLESQEPDEPLIEYSQYFLDAISSFCGRLIELGPRHQGNPFSCSTCTGIPTYFTGTPRSQECCDPRCVAILKTTVCNEKPNNWLLEQSISSLNSFPLFVRAALFSSLNPVQHNSLPGSSSKIFESLFGCYTLDIFVAFINEFTKFKIGGSETLHSCENIASLVHLLPLMILPRVDGKGKSALVMGDLNEKENCSKHSDLSPFHGNLLRLIKHGLVPLLECLKPQDHFPFQSIVSALSHIQAFKTDSPLQIQINDPVHILKFIVTKHERLQSVEATKDEISSTLCGMMFRLARKFTRKDADPTSRYFLWMCAARYFVTAPPSEIRQKILSKNPESTSTTIEQDEEKSKERDRDSLLPLFVAAPFSDRNGHLRKLIARELSSVLMSTEYSFLMARFSATEEFQEYCIYSRTAMEDRNDDNMHSLLQVSDEVAHGFFEEMDSVLNECCGFSETQLSLPLGREERQKKRQYEDFERESRLSMQRTAARILASLCFNASLNHPIGKIIFEKGALRLIRMWATTPPTNQDGSYPELQSTSLSRALAFGGLSPLSVSRNLSACLSEEIPWTYFPSAFFGDILILNNRRGRREQYEILETLVRSCLTSSQDSLQKMKATIEASKAVKESIPQIIAQLANEQDEETIQLIIGFNIFLAERCDHVKSLSSRDVSVIGVPELPMLKKSIALSMGTRQLVKKTKDLCLQKIDRILPLVLLQSDQDEALPLKFLMKLTAPVTLPDMMAGREQRILKGIAWELGRDPYRLGLAIRALRTAAVACGRENLDSNESDVDTLPGTAATRVWVTKNFMYLIVNMVQLNWGSRGTTQQVQALRCLHELLDFLDPSEAAQYFPQVMAAVNVAITVEKGADLDVPEKASLRLHAVKCLSKFIRLATKDNLETVIDNLTTIVVSLLPIIGDERCDNSKPILQEVKAEAVSMLEFLTRSEFVRKFSKAFSQIPFLPTSAALSNVHKSLRDNGINFDDLHILSTGTLDSQAGTNTRRESLTSENTSKAPSSANGDNVIALQNRLSLVYSLLDNENYSVRKVSLQHLVDLLRANRNLFLSFVESEGSTSIENYLTIIYERNQNGTNYEHPGHSKSTTSVNISNILDKLMNRCVHETNPRVRLQLATCLGEIGAIGENRLGDMSIFKSKGNEPVSMYQWRLNHPPWQSRVVRYELQLVTKYLVAALKAAPSQEEQLKIAFTIQQILVLLDDSVGIHDKKGGLLGDSSTPQKREMSKWLMDRLVEANVYDSVEPFWLSEFSTKDERHSRRQPPFFNTSKSYHLWISEFCRWMITKAKDCTLSRWKDFFFACRIAVRSLAGLETAEFILPLLVLDRICFGSIDEFEAICKEFIRVLDFDSNSALMDNSERQKAVGGFFGMMDTLSFWAETETEQRYRSKRTSHSKRSSRGNARRNSEDSLSNWPADETIIQIQELISRIPLIDQARAATNVGMHAKGLRLLEMVARKNIVEKFFESSSDEDKDSEIPMGGNLFQHDLLENVDLGLMKAVLSNLNDCETMNVIGENGYLANPLLQATDSIQWKEASGNYEGALRDYDRILQVNKVSNSGPESDTERGALDCMLKLGRFESVMDRVLNEDGDSDKIATKAFAVEAACHLGQWDRLSGLVEESEGIRFDNCSDDLYRRGIGKVVLCLRNEDAVSVSDALRTARTAVMENLSRVARESYSKAYTDIVKLQCIREFEDSASLFCGRDEGGIFTLHEIAESKSHEGWAWDGRLKVTTSRAAPTIMNTRVAISRLCNDRVMEGSLLLDLGKQAHHNGMPTVAEKYFSQAEATLSLTPELHNSQHQKLDCLLDDVRVQYAKLKKESGENLLALKILGQGMVQDALSEMNYQNIDDVESLRIVALKHERLRAEKTFGLPPSSCNDKELIDRFASRLLRLTQWTVEAGMQSGSEIISRYQTVIKLSQDWEKGHFQYAKYLNELVTRFFEKGHSRGDEDDAMRFDVLCKDRPCQQYILLAIEHYALTLKLDMKHVYQALPRLLSLWFDFVSLEPPELDPDGSSGSIKREYIQFLTENQNKANLCMADNTKTIPAAAYYTAMPQLLSRVIHNNEDTAKVVKRILERVLAKYPHQAMWHLAWLKGSKNAERSKIGGDIFKGAQKVLIKNRQTHVANLLKASDSLFKYLQDLARFTPKSNPNTDRTNMVSVKPWKGIADLSEFVPPVQAALSISPFKPVKSSSKDYFPRIIPRMRAFSSKVSVMQSKAKPKKLKAFAVPGTWKHANMSSGYDGGGRTSTSTPLDCDIGEIHFLVKQEAKGDLRKDARVQDLNNVINRLMSSSNNSNSTLASRSQRLHVRTFAVTCLSEDTGILEWVPDTDSLRNLVHRSYNAQSSTFCPRRRGSRMCNFADATLRSNFERAQNQFWKSGDITQAARLYYLLCLKPHPPVLSWWLVQNFPSATDWYEARKKFTLTAAAWSAIGHVIGLGDRHSENILVETTTGRVIHVDFDCIFDKGLNLPRPEVVPFRLTPNMLDAFGPTGADGMFSSGMECSLEILRGNQDTLLSVLEPFIKDPIIDWRKHRTQQNVLPSSKMPSDSHGEAKRSISVIKERLSGICNLRNPNYRKLRNIIPREELSRVEQDNMMIGILPLSVEGQVQKLCAEASKNENLVQLYVGWMPWV